MHIYNDVFEPGDRFTEWNLTTIWNFSKLDRRLILDRSEICSREGKGREGLGCLLFHQKAWCWGHLVECSLGPKGWFGDWFAKCVKASGSYLLFPPAILLDMVCSNTAPERRHKEEFSDLGITLPWGGQKKKTQSNLFHRPPPKKNLPWGSIYLHVPKADILSNKKFSVSCSLLIHVQCSISFVYLLQLDPIFIFSLIQSWLSYCDVFDFYFVCFVFWVSHNCDGEKEDGFWICFCFCFSWWNWELGMLNESLWEGGKEGGSPSRILIFTMGSKGSRMVR